ncbi:MAG: hypothetical protein IKN96_05480 [Oscillibacter sp.]|nr:hypothetical protein [Oscillibacter sp.]
MKAVLFGIYLLLFSIFLIICDTWGIGADWVALFSLPSAGFVLYGLLRGEWGGGASDSGNHDDSQ